MNQELEKTYGLGYPIQSFAVANPFIIQMNKTCYKFGKSLQTFGLFCNDTQTKAGVVDFTKVNGMVNQSVSLLDEVADYRADVYEQVFQSKIHFDKDSKLKEKYLFIDYLLSSSLCYIEIPKYVTKEGVAQQSYDKFLVTRNSAVMGAWMGMSTEEMQVKYGAKVTSNIYELTSGEVKFVKCVSGAKGNTISVPRSSFSVDNITTCIPLFMLHAFMKGLEPYHMDGILKFIYLKDNNTTRELCTTTSNAILMDYYHDQMRVDMMLNATDVNTTKIGGMQLSSKQHRGYVKVPELGLSKYDATGVRALNIARILTVEKISEVDRSFIDVDLDSCTGNFYDNLDYLVSHFPDKLPEVYSKLCGDAGTLPSDSSHATIVDAIHKFVDVRNILLSTTFHKALHRYMLSNPDLFPYYTGLPRQQTSTDSSENFGVEKMDF